MIVDDSGGGGFDSPALVLALHVRYRKYNQHKKNMPLSRESDPLLF